MTLARRFGFVGWFGLGFVAGGLAVARMFSARILRVVDGEDDG